MAQETDQLLVNSDSTTQIVTVKQMAELQDNDLMLVNRDGTTYTATGKEIKDSVNKGVDPDITIVVLTQNQVDSDRYTSNLFTTTVNYSEPPFPPAQVEMTAEVTGVLGLVAGTDEITTNNFSGTADSSVVLDLAGDANLGTTFKVGDNVKASASYTPETSSITNVNNNTLTLSSEKDIKLFQIGDVVQGSTYIGDWSSQVVGTPDPSPSYGIEKAFDGNINTTSTPAAGGNSLTFTASGFTPGDAIVVDTIEYNSGGGNSPTSDAYININGNQYQAEFAQDNNVRTGTVNNDGTVTIIWTTAINGGSPGWNYVGIRRIAIGEKYLLDTGVSDDNGVKVTATDVSAKTITVDGGKWDVSNKSQVWSNYISTPYGTLLNDAPATNAADGNLTTSAAPADKATTGNDPTLIFDITSIGGLPFTSSVRVYRDNGISGGTTVQFNNETAVASNFQAWTTIATGGGTLNKITTINASSNNTVGISAIEVDGELLVDPGTLDLGDSKVHTTTPKQGEGTISDITGSVVTIEPFTDNCFVEGQYLINATPQPILITPKTDAITDVTGNVLTFGGSKDLLNFAAGDPVSMCNADGSAATYNAETSLIESVGSVSSTLRGSWVLALDSSSGFSSEHPASGAFDGDPNTKAFAASSGIFSFTPSSPINISSTIGINSLVYGTDFYWELQLDGVVITVTPTSNYEKLITTAFAGKTISSDKPLIINMYNQSTNNPENTMLAGLYVDGKLLIDEAFPDPVANPANQLLTFNDVLTFTDPCPDLQYFRPGDEAQQEVLSTNQLIINTDTNNNNFYLEAVYLDGKMLWDQTSPGSVNPGTDYIEIFNSNSNASQLGRNWSNGQINGAPNGGITDSGWRPLIQDPGAILTWDNVIEFQDITVRVAQGQPAPVTGIITLPDGKIICNIDIPEQKNTFDVVEGLPVYVYLVISTDLAADRMTVDGGGLWLGTNGSGVAGGATTVQKSLSGTGEVVSTDPLNNTMNLTNSNDEWALGYYVQTPDKPLVEQTGYLMFTSNGNVTGVTLIPQAPTVMSSANPVLTFPGTFDTGSSPDTELPYPTSLLTRITASNVNTEGQTVSSSGVSNTLFPASTSTFLVPACCQVEYTGAGVAQLIANLQTFSGREAAANTDPTDVGSRVTSATSDINSYIAGL